MDRGIVLAGGGALLTGLDERLRHETQMPVHLAESPLTCVAVGSGRSLEEFEAIHRCNKARSPQRPPPLLGREASINSVGGRPAVTCGGGSTQSQRARGGARLVGSALEAYAVPLEGSQRAHSPGDRRRRSSSSHWRS